MIVELNDVGHLTDIALVSDRMTPVTFRNPVASVDGLVIYSTAAWYSRATAGGAQTAYAAGVPLVLSRAAGTLGDTDTTYHFSGTAPLRVITRDQGSIRQPYILVDSVTEFTEDEGITFNSPTTVDSSLAVNDGLSVDEVSEVTPDAGVTVDGVNCKDGTASATAVVVTGDVTAGTGMSPTVGCTIGRLDEVVEAAGVETAMSNAVPAGAVILTVTANADAALTGGGTTATWSLGVTGDVDKYGTAGYPNAGDSLAQNSKSQWVGGFEPLASAETIKLCAAATGGASAGDTALTAGSVRIVVTYLVAGTLPDTEEA